MDIDLEHTGRPKHGLELCAMSGGGKKGQSPASGKNRGQALVDWRLEAGAAAVALLRAEPRAMGGGNHDELPQGPASQKEMADANIAIGYRDACAHLLIPLNKSAARVVGLADGGGAHGGAGAGREDAGPPAASSSRHAAVPRCRRKTFYMPWECGHLRHEYEKCQHIEWLKRHKDDKMREQAAQGH